MSARVSNAARVMEGQTVATPYLDGMVGAVPDRPQVTPGNCVTGPDLCALLAEAIDATGSRKEAAADMGISGPVLTKQLQRTDDAAPRLDRLSGLKRETLVSFADRIKSAYGEGDPRVERRQAAEDAMRAMTKLVALAVSEESA